MADPAFDLDFKPAYGEAVPVAPLIQRQQSFRLHLPWHQLLYRRRPFRRRHRSRSGG